MKRASRRRNKKILSIDLGSHSIKFAEGQFMGDRVKISAVHSVAINPEVYDNGSIQDTMELKSVIQGALKDSGIRTKDCVVTIESTELIKRDMVIPKVDSEDRLDLITYEVGQYLPINVDNYVIQYKDVGDVKEDDVEKSKVLIGAMPREIVQVHYEFLESCGLNPIFLDIHSNSVEKLVEIGLDNSMYQSLALIDFGHRLVDVTFIDQHEYKFNRLLRFGSSISNDLINNNLSLDKEEIVEYKNKIDVAKLTKKISAMNDMTEEDVDAMRVSERVEVELADYFDELADEINKVLQYYTTRSSENEIHKVILYGGSAHFANLRTFLKDRLERDIEFFDLNSKIEFDKFLKPEETLEYINAIGAIIRN